MMKIAFEGVEDFVELKYKYITLQMYSYDMLGNLLTIIDKICDSYKYPSVNVCLLTGNRGKIITYVIRPSMVLIRYMITLLIQSRGNAFKDLSPIKTLLKLYNLMYYVPECSSIREDAIKVSKDINKILEIYVGIKIGSSMINELLVWTLSSPSVFSSSLSLLCNLLPSPLPIQTLKPLDESVVTTMISFRNMWIEHLGKCNKDLVELITVLGSSNILLQPLKWLCIKISNLNMSMSLLIAQTLLDVFINIDNDNYFNTYLNLLLQLCDNKKYVIIKSAVIHILNEEKSKESYNKFVEKLCENIQQKKQEKSITFVRCLCNSDIILDGNDVKENLPRGSAPNGWILNNILKALLSSFESHTLSSTQSLIVETCIMIINSDYGFYQFKIVLDTFTKPFFNILNYLTQVWNKEDTHCVNTLMLIVQLINLCIKNDINTKRLLFMNMSQLKEYLNWTNNVKDHPICLLKEIIKEQNSICYQNLISLIELLNNEQDSITEFIEPQLATNDFLTDMFKDRLFYNICINEENCLNHNNDTNEPEVLIECNVEEIVSDWPDFNIKNKINDLFKIEDCIAQPELISHKQQEPIITEKKENAPNTSVIPMPTRHKVFSRLGTVQRPDIFRNRLPNTSRPPSLHVDEFVAMETRSVRQPPRYKSPIQPIQDLNIRLHERHMAYQRSYNLYSPYKSHLSLHSWHAQVNALAHLRADYRQTINSRHLELQRHSLVAEWRQLRVEAVLRKKTCIFKTINNNICLEIII